LILCKDISFSYERGVEILKNLNLEVKPGLALLLGSNGCGKTTLLRLVAGVEMADSGKILINGIDLWEQEVKARNQLVYFPEYPDLTPYATIKEIVDLVCRLRDQPLKTGEDALRETGLHKLMNRTVRELSNGQRRRAIFASCLVGNASIILLDEPLEGMDSRIQQMIISWVNRHRNDGSTILLASHSFQPFISLADQALTIRNGQADHYKDLPRNHNQKKRFLEKLAGN
jgi:ABC-type multidrug transport system ATPase subunit